MSYAVPNSSTRILNTRCVLRAVLQRDNWPTKVCGEGAPCTKVSSQDAYHHYAVGPPLILDSSDMKPLTSLWAEYMPACGKLTDGDILADMWACVKHHSASFRSAWA